MDISNSEFTFPTMKIIIFYKAKFLDIYSSIPTFFIIINSLHLKYDRVSDFIPYTMLASFIFKAQGYKLKRNILFYQDNISAIKVLGMERTLVEVNQGTFI